MSDAVPRDQPAPQPAGNQPRTIRLRNAVIVAVASLVVGVGLGATTNPQAPATGPGASTVAVAASAPLATPTAVTVPTVGPSAAVPVAVTPTPAKPVVVKGTGNQKTKPFTMPGGDFTVTITGNGDGNVIAGLNPRSGGALSEQNLFNEISDGKYKYETVVYGIESGSYYLDVINDNAWVVTFAPLR